MDEDRQPRYQIVTMTQDVDTPRAPGRVSVALAFDAAFAGYAACTMASVLANTDAEVEFFILATGMEDPHAQALERVARRFGAPIQLVPVESSEFATWRAGFHFSPAVYLRLLIPDLVPRDRVLYLDADVIATTDVAELFFSDLSGCWVAGVSDGVGGRTTRMRLPPGEPYINSGVMVLDCAQLRAAGFSQVCRARYRELQDDIRWVDQDLINVVAAGRKRVLDSVWNILATDHGTFDLEAKVAHLEGRALYHGSGKVKPWMSWSDPWLAQLWMSYARLTGLPLAQLEIRPRNLREWSLQADAHDRAGEWKQSTDIRRRIISRLEAQFREERTRQGGPTG